MSTPDALLSAGLARFHAGDPSGAIELLRGAIESSPGNALYHFHLGNMYWHEQRGADAVSCFREAQRLDPNIGGLPLRMGLECAANGQLEEADGCLRLALFLSGRGAAAGDLGDLLEQAVPIVPDSAEMLSHLGVALCHADRLEPAVAVLERLIAISPADAQARNNLAVALKYSGRIEQALAHLEEAVRLAPDFAEARLNRAMLLLLTGDFTRGWPEYEWRPKRELPVLFPPGADLHGKTVLLHAEQGLGDLIQFVRYAANLEQRGARVLVECPEATHELVRTARGVGDVTPLGIFPQSDFNSHLLSLPGLLPPEPVDIPYLSPNPRRVEYWRSRLGGGAQIRVGLAWAGSAQNPNDRRRSMPAAELEPILRHPRVAAYSLQLGPRAAELDLPQIGSAGLMDTAAAMMALDLIISVDTMPAHLAGALGRPVWLLLPFVPDWRWGLSGDRTPWYPTMQLFRQPRAGDWNAVVQGCARSLYSRPS